MTKKWKYFLAILGLAVATTWFAVIAAPDEKLHLIACDVGQGDAILAAYGDTQILVDGGSGNKVLNCLEQYMPFWDKEIELVVLTHPQKDHFGGLIDVFKNYQVDKFVSTGLDSSSRDYQVLKNIVGGSGCEVVNPTTGMVVRLGLIHLDILWPTENFLVENFTGSFTTTRDPNDFSVVAILRFGEFDALLTGDIGPDITDEILATGLVEDVEYIKIPHHGSKNGLTQELLDASDPEIAVISVGKNSYGHPHGEVLDMLSRYDLQVFRTDQDGSVEIITDGDRFWMGE